MDIHVVTYMRNDDTYVHDMVARTACYFCIAPRLRYLVCIKYAAYRQRRDDAPECKYATVGTGNDGPDGHWKGEACNNCSYTHAMAMIVDVIEVFGVLRHIEIPIGYGYGSSKGSVCQCDGEGYCR